MSDKIDLSSYSIQKKWIEEVAPNYFNVDDINMLKAGLFGYMNEVLSNSFEDALHMQTIMSKEIFPNKAVLPDSIYTYSALADFNDFYAVGATVPIVLALKKEDIIKNSDLNPTTNYLELYISKYSSLIIDNKIPFILDYDIKIISRKNKNDYIMSAQYIMNEINELSDIKTPFITSAVLTNANDTYMYLTLNCRQLSRTTVSHLVYSNDAVENIDYEAEYEGRLAGFNVYYKPNSYLDEKILLTKYFTGTAIPDDSSEKFCMYSLNSANKINISFSAHPSYFRPRFNSELIIEVFTTLGEDGNFVYNGENNSIELISPISDKDISNIKAFCNVIQDSKGGKNEPSLTEIKQKVIKEFSIRKNIITENDLTNYFLDKTENCDIYFCKKRDDVIRRMYTAFMLLRNDNNEVIPTNTIDIAVYQDQVDNYIKNSPVYTIKAGTIFEGSEGTTTFNKADENLSWMELLQHDSNLTTSYPATPTDKRTNYLYGTPFLIKINSNPLFMSYYLNSIYDKIILSYSYMNESSYEEFIMSNLSVLRNAIKENYYTLETVIATTVDVNDMFNTYKDNGELKISGFNMFSEKHIQLYGVIEEENEVVGYIKFEPYKLDENKIYYRAILETDDLINTEDKINIINSIYTPTNSIENLKATFALGNDKVKLNLCVYYDGYGTNKIKEKYIKNIPNMEDYALCNIYKTDSNLQLFKNLNSIMNSSISMRISENSKHPGFYYKIKKVPMIRYMYMQNDDNMKEIISKLDTLKDVLIQCLPDMEINFILDTKFYNTYGESKYFTIGRRKETLNMVSISVTLNIKLSVEVTSDLIKELKTYIANFIEATNNNDTNFLYISNLIRNLEQEFNEITYIEFVGFNNYDSSKQIIENNFTDMSEFTKEQVIDFVPEYLNINRHIVLDNGQLIFEPRIFLNFI